MTRKEYQPLQRYLSDGKVYETRRIRPLSIALWGADGDQVAVIIEVISQTFKDQNTYKVGKLTKDRKSIDPDSVEVLTDEQLIVRGWSITPKGPRWEELPEVDAKKSDRNESVDSSKIDSNNS